MFQSVKTDREMWIDVDAGSETNTFVALNSGRCPKDITSQTGLSFTHHENEFVDFNRDQFLFMMKSTEGPHLASGDLNGDHLEDIIMAKGQAAAIFYKMQMENLI
jgi:hypothetical protein